MKISLLYRENANEGNISDEVFQDLKINDIFAAITPDTLSRKIFLNVLSHPLICIDDINYRQEILKDFLENPSLFSALSEKIGDYMDLKKQMSLLTNDDRVRYYDNLSLFRSTLQEKSSLLRRCYYFIIDVENILAAFTVESRGLKCLKDKIKDLSEDPFLDQQIQEICNKFEYITSMDTLKVRISLNKLGMISQCDVMNTVVSQETSITNRRFELKKYKFGKKSGDPTKNAVGIQLRNAIMENAFQNMLHLIKCIIQEFLTRFLFFFNELPFYKTAIQYVSFCAKKNIQLIFPQLSSSIQIEYLNLYSIDLLARSVSAELLVPNNYFLSTNTQGIIILGDNNSGKTVYMSSFALAQLMAQAGLPIPATSATTCIFHNLFTLYAGGESNENSFGRFEEEVSKFSSIINIASSASLIMVNEIFQSTAYQEGTKALSDILKYLCEKNIKWMVVSHLRELKNHMSGCRTNLIMLTSEHQAKALE